MKLKRGNRRRPRSLLVQRRLRIWWTTWGHGDTSEPGILLTDDSPCPSPLAFILGDGAGAARHAAERIILGAPIAEEASYDLRELSSNRFACEIAGNLMFPVRPFSRDCIDESNPLLAAAWYTPDAACNGIGRFSIISLSGLQELFLKIPIIRCGPALEKAMKGFES
jgi:hypothetical protein